MDTPIKINSRVAYYQYDQFIGYGKIIDSGTKNGCKVYDVKLDNGKTHWGYIEQFKRVSEN